MQKHFFFILCLSGSIFTFAQNECSKIIRFSESLFVDAGLQVPCCRLVSNDLTEQNIKPQSVFRFKEPGFSAKIINGRTNLCWTTLNENNIDVFIIQRSKDREDFETVSLTKGAGNSSLDINYQEKDYSPYSGLSYYRLLSIDHEGKSKYSLLMPVVNYGDVRPIGRNKISPITELSKSAMEDAKEVLLVLKDSTGKEYYSKFVVTEVGEDLIGVDIEKKVSPGKYLIVATSNNKFYGKSITVN